MWEEGRLQNILNPFTLDQVAALIYLLTYFLKVSILKIKSKYLRKIDGICDLSTMYQLILLII